jgi:hypothetical protein
MARSRANGGLLMAALLIVAGVAGACGAGPTANNAGLPPDCEHWCGNGSATVTIGGSTTTISGGDCYDQGSAGEDVRFGDWEDDSEQLNYLALTAYRSGGPTPPATAAVLPPTGPGTPEPTEPPDYNVSGSVDGNPFILDVGALVTLGASGKGTFSGIDIDGAGAISGTFSCG